MDQDRIRDRAMRQWERLVLVRAFRQGAYIVGPEESIGIGETAFVGAGFGNTAGRAFGQSHPTEIARMRGRGRWIGQA